MTGKNQIRLNHKAMRDVVQYYLNCKFMGVAPTVTSIYQTGTVFVVHIDDKSKTQK